MNQKSTMKEMLADERPYEKCERFGAGSLTNIELLAVLLRSGTRGMNSLELARKLLYPEEGRGQDGMVHLQSWTKEELLRIPGIGKVKAIQILCICELSKRLSQMAAVNGLDFGKPAAVARYYMEDMRHRRQEYMKLVMLNTRSRFLGDSEISKGTVNMSVITPRELFVEALQKNAVYIILLHNHPGGDPTPSKDDILMTRRIRDAGRLIGIELLDHIIIGDNRYISLREDGYLDEKAADRKES
ncbi:DNA repair protein RadC [Roseburia hominis]